MYTVVLNIYQSDKPIKSFFRTVSPAEPIEKVVQIRAKGINRQHISQDTVLQMNESVDELINNFIRIRQLDLQTIAATDISVKCFILRPGQTIKQLNKPKYLKGAYTADVEVEKISPKFKFEHAMLDIADAQRVHKEKAKALPLTGDSTSRLIARCLDAVAETNAIVTAEQLPDDEQSIAGDMASNTSSREITPVRTLKRPDSPHPFFSSKAVPAEQRTEEGVSRKLFENIEALSI